VADTMNVRTSLFALFALSALTGATVFHCSSGSGTVGVASISSRSKNRAPAATDSVLTAQRNATVSGFMQASDPDGDDLVFSLVVTPTLGVVNVTDTSTGAFTYLSSATGSDSFSFKANDGQTDSNVATVSITVSEIQVSWEVITEMPSREDQASVEVHCLHTSGAVLASEGQVADDDVKPQAFSQSCKVADPFDPGHLLSSSDKCGLMLTDGGLTWDALDLGSFLTARCHHLLIHFNPFQPGLVYLGVNKTDGEARLLRSTDGGFRWKVISTQLPGHFETLRSAVSSARGEIRLIAKFDHDAKRYSGVDWPFGNWTSD
jgi:hypothetical protein